jgi:hypothetical protein
MESKSTYSQLKTTAWGMCQSMAKLLVVAPKVIALCLFRRY